MNKSLILIIIFSIFAIFIASVNTELIHNGMSNVKIIIQGESNKEPIAEITNNLNNSKNNTNNNTNYNSNSNTNNNTIINSIKIYNKNGIYFQYPSYWNYDQLNKLVSLYQKEYLSRWDDGVIFYISDYSIEEELKMQQETERYKHKKSLNVDNKKAYSLSTTKADYWQYLILVEKNNKETYIITFYCDQELKKEDKVLFDGILSTMKLRQN